MKHYEQSSPVVAAVENYSVDQDKKRRNRTLFPLLLFALVLVVNQNWWRIELLIDPPETQHLSAEDVVMFSTSWCGYCAKARRYFKSANIPFTELDIERSSEAMQHYQSLGGNGVPFIIIRGQTIQGYDRASIRTALNQINPL